MGNKGERGEQILQSEPLRQSSVADRLVVAMPDEALAEQGFEKYDRVVRNELPPEFRPRFTRLGDPTRYRGQI
jgi:hypothetical protein